MEQYGLEFYNFNYLKQTDVFVNKYKIPTLFLYLKSKEIVFVVYEDGGIYLHCACYSRNY